MSKPFPLRMDDDTHEHLLARAERTSASASQLANRYYAAYRDDLDTAIRAHLAVQDNFERVIRQRNARAARRAATA